LIIEKTKKYSVILDEAQSTRWVEVTTSQGEEEERGATFYFRHTQENVSQVQTTAEYQANGNLDKVTVEIAAFDQSDLSGMSVDQRYSKISDMPPGDKFKELASIYDFREDDETFAYVPRMEEIEGKIKPEEVDRVTEIVADLADEGKQALPMPLTDKKYDDFTEIILLEALDRLAQNDDLTPETAVNVSLSNLLDGYYYRIQNIGALAISLVPQDKNLAITVGSVEDEIMEDEDREPDRTVQPGSESQLQIQGCAIKIAFDGKKVGFTLEPAGANVPKIDLQIPTSIDLVQLKAQIAKAKASDWKKALDQFSVKVG
jgi:hypothetical protein